MSKLNFLSFWSNIAFGTINIIYQIYSKRIDRVLVIKFPYSGFKAYKGKTIFNNLRFKIINNGNSPCLLERFAIEIDSYPKFLNLAEIKKDEESGNYKIIITTKGGSKNRRPFTLEAKSMIEYFDVPLELNFEINKKKVEVIFKLAVPPLFRKTENYRWKNYKFTVPREFIKD